MLVQQRTIKQSVSMSGVGLHTGNISHHDVQACTGELRGPVAADRPGGRAGGSGGRRSCGRYFPGDHIELGTARVHTVEHVMAALVGLQIDNILIELDNNEPPIGDGSAKPYVECLLQAGFEIQEAPKDYLIIDQTVHYQNEAKKVEIVALPTDDYRITVLVDYENPALGSQHTGLFDLEKEFVSEFAPCRTFCFLHEVEMLHSAGLIRGGNLDNAIVIVDRDLPESEIKRISEKLGINDSVILGSNGVINNRTLHFPNEPARHKLLDVMGDLALIGVPLKAQILAARPGHASNIEFARKIRRLYEQKKLVRKYQHERKEGVVFDINAIKRILPHRYPFLLDRQDHRVQDGRDDRRGEERHR